MTEDPGGRGRATRLMDRRSERDALDRLIEAVRIGQSRALVVRGDAGVGKTVLLDYLAGQARGCRVARVMGVQSEMELAFAGLHQLCGGMLDHADSIPVPQRDVLRTVFGLAAGPPPEPFLIGLAVLSLLSEVARQRPLICLIDDEQWLDHASAQALGFTARRLGAEPVGLVFAARVAGGELARLPELEVDGLREDDARALLASALAGPLDARVRDLIIAETRGNPLALLELPRGLSPAELAGGFGLPGAAPLTGRIEDSFTRQLAGLPDQTRRLLQLAAADPSGDRALVWRAAGRLGLPVQAGTRAVEAGLVEFGAGVWFRHPLVRSAAYRSAAVSDRQQLHAALAAVTDPQADPDRRAWHRAQAAAGPDEAVAGELEASAGRAQARGGLAAAAAFLDRAAALTPEPAQRVWRLLAAARAKRDAGALDAALELLRQAEAGPLDALGTAEVEHLRGQIAMERRRGGDAARQLTDAAGRFERLDGLRARQTHLEALGAAIWAGDLEHPGMLREIAEAARAAPPAAGTPRPADVLLDALAIRLTQGYGAAAPVMTRALDMILAVDPGTGLDVSDWLWLLGARAGGILAIELWDADAVYTLAARQVQVARDAGALVHLQFALNFLTTPHLLAGELATAADLLDEERLLADATGNRPVAYTRMMGAAWRGREAEAADLIGAATREATTDGMGRMINFADQARAVLYNGLGRYDAARDAARRAFERDQVGCGPFIMPELAEAASRSGDAPLLRAALEWLSEQTRVTSSDWALGIHARIRALLSDGEAAEDGYRESIQRLGRTRVRPELARSHLLYGEWLRREGRRADARDQLRTAHQMLDAMGLEAFAERARHELIAVGETVRQRSVGTVITLTAQEAVIARLARDGRTNPEIGAQLFLSARTVEWHLRKVFTKLGVSRRRDLDAALAQLGQDGPPA
jgi:DNA-binding CsgD family transcriptional regulator